MQPENTRALNFLIYKRKVRTTRRAGIITCGALAHNQSYVWRLFSDFNYFAANLINVVYRSLALQLDNTPKSRLKSNLCNFQRYRVEAQRIIHGTRFRQAPFPPIVVIVVFLLSLVFALHFWYWRESRINCDLWTRNWYFQLRGADLLLTSADLITRMLNLLFGSNFQHAEG